MTCSDWVCSNTGQFQVLVPVACSWGLNPGSAAAHTAWHTHTYRCSANANANANASEQHVFHTLTELALHDKKGNSNLIGSTLTRVVRDVFLHIKHYTKHSTEQQSCCP